MSCFCLEYVDVNKCTLQFCSHSYVFVANDVYCCEANPTTQNFKFFPLSFVQYSPSTDSSVGRTLKVPPSCSWFLSIIPSTLVFSTGWWRMQIIYSQSGSHLFQYLLPKQGIELLWKVIPNGLSPHCVTAEPTLCHHWPHTVSLPSSHSVTAEATLCHHWAHTLTPLSPYSDTTEPTLCHHWAHTLSPLTPHCVTAFRVQKG